jgi:hypothetical protein
VLSVVFGASAGIVQTNAHPPSTRAAIHLIIATGARIGPEAIVYGPYPIKQRTPDVCSLVTNVRMWREAAISNLGACLAPCPHAPAPYRLIRSVGRRGEAAIERPINSSTLQRQAFPQAAWNHAQDVGRVAGIRSASRAWRSRPRTTLDRPHPQNILVAPLVARQPRDALPARAFLSSVCFRTVQATLRMALIAAIPEAAAAPVT